MSGIDSVIVWGRGKTGRGHLNEIVKKGGREGLGDWKGGWRERERWHGEGESTGGNEERREARGRGKDVGR